MKDYRLELKVRNNYLLSLMDDRGIKTAAELHRLTGVEQSSIGAILNLKVTPFRKDGDLILSVSRLIDFFYCGVEDIFPPQHIEEALGQNKFEAELSKDELLTLSSPGLTTLQLQDLKIDLKKAKECLSDREREMIDMRFNRQMTYKEIGIAFDIGSERVRQIEQRSLRKIRGTVVAADYRD